MALTFEYEKDLSTGSNPFISHESDSTLYNYYINEEAAKDTNALAAYGQYDDIKFSGEERHLTTKAVSKIGIKNFPGIGGIGFYRDAYSDTHLIAAPIHTDRVTYEAPALLKAIREDGKLHIVVSPPTNMNYNCYRIIARQDAFAFEYITYKTECYVDMPTVKGTYDVYCIGYDEANGTVSEDSNIVRVLVATGDASWIPRSDDVNDLITRVQALEESIGDIGTTLDEINGVEV